MKDGNEAEEYYDLVDNANDFIQRVTPEGKFLYVNRAWKETFGYSEEELDKLTLFDVVHPDSLAHCGEIFQRVLSGEKVVGIEAVFVTKDGREITVEGSANCYFKEGKPVATMGIFRDITERKEVEKLKQQQKVLEISESNLREFSRKILDIREEERKKLSMDLHDEMGSMAIGLNSGLQIIEKAVENNNLQSALENVSRSKSALKKTIGSLRKIATDLSPANLDAIGLPNALREYFSNI